jgi:hypothetical protein
MSTTLKKDQGRLRFGVGSVGLSDGRGEPRESGVLVYKEIPVGAVVFARVNRPTELPESDAGAAGSAGATAAYAFEHAPIPATFKCGSGGAIVSNGLNRVLVADGKGTLTKYGQVPVFAAFAAPITGAIVQKGKANHAITMATLSGAKALEDAKAEMLRIRWTGTAQGSTLLVTADGTAKSYSGKLVNAAHKNIAPGSVVITGTFAGNAFTARDDGNGKIIGVQVVSGIATLAIDGSFDYLEGAFALKFDDGAGGGAPTAGAINIAYEHTTKFIPLDVDVEWDTDAQ